jgi:hypothetical protein
MRARRLRALLALTLLLALATAFAGSFVHTDDGCAVEQHCLACRWAHATFSLPALALIPAVEFEPIGEVVAAVHAASTTEAPAETPARAPPLA